MKIENLRLENHNDLARAAATVVWEDCDRPTQEIYFQTTKEFAQDLSCNPHAFLVSCIMPAMHHGEKRLSIDAQICPELHEGLITSMGWLHNWYGSSGHQIVQIEAQKRSNLPKPRTPERAGSFFSGGVDALATLRTNHLNFSPEHPQFIKDGLFIYGLEIDRLELFEHVVKLFAPVAQEAGITLIPVYTNIRYLDEDWSFWGKEFQGAVLAAVAHAFSKRLTTVTIPSSFDILHLYPYGSHPVLDPNYSSSDLRIRHDSILLSRLAKTKLVADWDVALQNLRVCTLTHLLQPGELNCGQCEKCLRTMTALLALGKLEKTQAFPKTDVSAELLLAKVKIKDPPYAESSYQELIAPLAARGRYDLVYAIEHVIAKYHRKQKIEQIDRRLFQGNVRKFYQAAFRRKGNTKVMNKAQSLA